MKQKASICAAIIVCLASCGVEKKQNAQASQPAWQGTYCGTIPAASSPGICRMVAVDGEHYEMMDKYLESPGVSLSGGQLKGVNDTLLIDNVPYLMGPGILFNSTDTLRLVSRATTLPQVYKQTLLQDMRSGEKAVLFRSLVEGKPKAELTFRGKLFNLTMNEANTQENEYVSGQTRLLMETIDPAPTPASLTAPLLMVDGATRHEFRILSPTSGVYAARHQPTVEVVYFGYEASQVAWVLSTDLQLNHVLPLRALGRSHGDATFGIGPLTWHCRGNRGELTYKGQKHALTRE